MTASPPVRRLSSHEVDTLLAWAADEGWNPGLADRGAFLAADPDGFWGCFVDDRMVAGLSAVRYGAAFGFIGLYITHPDFRGQGFGRRVWEAGMQHLDGRTIGLDGVPQQQQTYRRMGFVKNYETIRWTGICPPTASAPTRAVHSITENHFPNILLLDRLHFPGNRPDFLSAFLKPPSVAKLIVRNQQAVAYGICRPCRDGHKIGPVFAETLDDAQALVCALTAEILGGAVQIDVPAAQAEFADWLNTLGFEPGFATARMYRGKPPQISLPGVFAITTLELG